MSFLRSKRKLKVLFCGHDFKFISHFVNRCQQRDFYDVRVFEQEGHHIDSEEKAREHLNWADVIFCEWALGNAVWFSHQKRDDQILIVRLHAQETRARDRIDFIWKIDWSRVDKLVLVTPHVYDWMIDEFPVLRSRSCLIYNPIDTKSEFSLPGKPDRRFRLGIAGIVPGLKRVDVAVEVFTELKKQDDRFTLHLKGKRPDEYPWMKGRPQEMNWFRGVFEHISALKHTYPSSVFFDPHGSDMPEWYSKNGFVLSTSDSEGSHQVVAEAMASGCIPIIRNWHGADRIYPRKFVVSSIPELVELVRVHSDPERFARESEYCKQFAENRFEEEIICDRLEALFFQSRNGLVAAAVPGSFAAETARAMPTILIVAYLPVGATGGYRIRVEEEIKVLVQMGCRVLLACLVPDKPAGKSTGSPIDHHPSSSVLDAHQAEFEKLGCKTHFIFTNDFFALDATSGGLRGPVEKLAKIVRDFDVDVVHCEAIYCGRLGLLLKQKERDVRLSVDWHGVGPEEEILNGAHRNRINALEKWERKILKVCDLNVYVSNEMKNHFLQKYGEVQTPYAIVPCCVSDEWFDRATTTDALATLDVPTDGVIVAYAGTMANWQCGREMMKLFAEIHRQDATAFFLLLVPKSDQRKTSSWADEFGLPASSYHLHEVAHREVPAYLQAAHIGVLLRRDDPVNRVSSPTKFAEYLSAGIPVLMTDSVGDYSDLAEEEKVGLVLSASMLDEDQYDREDLGNIIAFARNSAEDRDHVKKRCLEVAYNHLLWQPAVKEWIHSYKDQQ